MNLNSSAGSRIGAKSEPVRAFLPTPLGHLFELLSILSASGYREAHHSQGRAAAPPPRLFSVSKVFKVSKIAGAFTTTFFNGGFEC
jgi:hypothetical protein